MERVNFACPVCGADLSEQAMAEAHDWSEGLPHLVGAFCERCQMDREFSLGWSSPVLMVAQPIVDGCPICGKRVRDYFEIVADEPFTADDPREGLMVWGVYSAAKDVICQAGPWVHFRYEDGRERLVRMMSVKWRSLE